MREVEIKKMSLGKSASQMKDDSMLAFLASYAKKSPRRTSLPSSGTASASSTR
ncbi:MAG: hypothetical protein ABI347_10605 [Nitrososphaera sp.]